MSMIVIRIYSKEGDASVESANNLRYDSKVDIDHGKHPSGSCMMRVLVILIILILYKLSTLK